MRGTETNKKNRISTLLLLAAPRWRKHRGSTISQSKLRAKLIPTETTSSYFVCHGFAFNKLLFDWIFNWNYKIFEVGIGIYTHASSTAMARKVHTISIPEFTANFVVAFFLSCTPNLAQLRIRQSALNLLSHWQPHRWLRVAIGSTLTSINQ